MLCCASKYLTHGNRGRKCFDKKCKHVAGPNAKDDIAMMMMTKTAFVFTLRLLKI